MKNYLDSLNEKQKNACMDTEGPSLIVAGAGSGKTKVLTSRIAYLIEEKGIAPENILAITFTNKAAKEMKDRINKLVKTDSSLVTAKTFHSFSCLVLRNEIEILKERTRFFQILDDDESEALIKDSMKALDYDTKMINPKQIQSSISLIKSKIKTLFDYPDFQRDKISNIMDEYNKRLIKNNLVDFDDLILLTYEIFKNYPKILEKYQDQYLYILVDEFQDTSNIQYDLIELLASKHRNVFIVGDEDQSIYSFRGANIKNIRKFMNKFKDHHEHILDENYRSTKKILDTANSLISNNKERIKKDLWTSSLKEGSVEIYHAENDKDEARYISKTIIRKVKEGYKYKDFAILYRNNYLSRNFENDLMALRIPYRIYSGMSFYKRKEVKEMIAYLRLILNPDDFYSFKKIINVPKRGIGDTTVSKIEDAYLKTESLKEAIDTVAISKSTRTLLYDFLDMIYSLRGNFEKYTLKEFFNQVYEKSGYKSFIEEIPDEEERENRSQNIHELLNSILEQETPGSIEETISDFLQNVALLTELDLESKNDDSVSLITMHSCKGLEYRCVFVTCLEDDIIPGNHSVLPLETEEERRLLYVALTRAKENLYISCSSSRYKYGRVDYMRSSRFIKELNLDEHINKPTINKPSLFMDKPKEKKETLVGEFKVNDKIYHEMYQKGIILAEVEGFYIIKFDNFPSPKKIVVNHPLLKKQE